MSDLFRKAQRSQARLRCALIGPSGSGKTFSALALATNLGKKVALIDTERGSSEKYALGSDGGFDFDVCPLENYHPRQYIAAIQAAADAGYDVLIIDSLSHAWSGVGGALDLADQAAVKTRSNNRFAAWREVTPLHNTLVDAILTSPMHVIVTMRAKTEWVIEKDDKGRSVPRKVGLAAVQRDGMEYEFDVVGDLDIDHNLIVSKTRCKALDGAVIQLPGEQLARQLSAWLSDGEKAPEIRKATRPEPAKKPAPTKEAEVEAEAKTEPENTSPATTATPLPWWTNPDAASAGVRELVEKMPAVLKTIKADLTDDDLEFARWKCCEQFGVTSMDEIPEEEVEILRSFMKRGMISKMRDEGMLPAARARS